MQEVAVLSVSKKSMEEVCSILNDYTRENNYSFLDVHLRAYHGDRVQRELHSKLVRLLGCDSSFTIHFMSNGRESEIIEVLTYEGKFVPISEI